MLNKFSALTPDMFNTTEEFGWVAYLKGGIRVCEGQATGDNPYNFMHTGCSSEFLPADQVYALGYVPLKDPKTPLLLCEIDLDRGERFVRKWTNVWRNGMGMVRLYAVGWYREVNGEKKYNIVYIYPKQSTNGQLRLAMSVKMKDQPPAVLTDPFCLLPRETIVTQHTGSVYWNHDGEPANLISVPRGVIFRSRQ